MAPGARRASDGELMGRMQAGDVEAFGCLYDRYERRAHRVAQLVCRDREGAEDAVQEAFISLWNSRAGFRSNRGRVDAWLLGIVRNRAIDGIRSDDRHARRRTAAERSEVAWSGEPAGPDDEAVAHEATSRLRDLLGRLPAAQRDVIALAYFAELTHDEIAERLNLPLGTVKGRMRLGLDKLRRDTAA